MNDGQFPDEIVIRLKKVQSLRYGENPHQSAALYVPAQAQGAADPVSGIAGAEQLQGKELSYNNIQDADAALDCVSEFSEPACVIVKHMNPCGVAVAADTHGAYLKAYACDTVSAFGGIVALNRTLDKRTAEEIAKIFVEVIIAPDIDADALVVFSGKPNVRILKTVIPDASRRDMLVRSVSGGYLAQSRDAVVLNELKPVTKREPTEKELSDLRLAFVVVKHVKSNAIVYVKDGATLGIGAGQMSRIYSAKIAAMKAADAGLDLTGSVMASDAFFPFPDCVEAAHEAGATAIVQPGGSLKDQDSIDACDRFGLTMVFTGVRHFRH
ncbi:bifunctional phosphoribosylaminoimidazolecarboxamide formyltransferase/IMP cyclohydrolase [Candidatus Kaiserbacteria bacterium]|nr:bifunctional phosphoribosylaminoimidazolecarboxamide formyltransferase/IMP cyclohydrolase [Candidatus Kaiserbacteria bacterium]